MKKFRYAILALIVSLVVIIPAGRSFYVWIMEKPGLFDAKNTAVVSVEKPGEITVWYYTEAMTDGRYTRVDDMPDGVKITAHYQGQNLPVKIDHTTTVTLSDGERKSIFSIPAEREGKYVIELGDTPKTIKFAVTVGSGIRGFFLGFFLCSFGLVLCLATAVLTVLAAANVFPKAGGDLNLQPANIRRNNNENHQTSHWLSGRALCAGAGDESHDRAGHPPH